MIGKALKTAFSGVLSGPGWLRARRGRMAGTVLVLCYHDLRRDDDLDSWMRVSRTDFIEQLLDLRQIGRFVGLKDLQEPGALDADGLNLLVTFDDGYRNNHALAAPILHDLKIPAVFFVSTAHTASGEPFWFDKIITPVQALKLEELDLRDFGLARYRLPLTGPQDRWSAIDEVLVDIKNAGNMDDDLNARLEGHFQTEFGARVADRLEEYRPFLVSEIQAMADDPLFTFGSHSHRHDILVKLDDTALRENLLESRELLEAWTGERPVSMAYPNGDHDIRVREAVAAEGYEMAFATQPALLDDAADRLALPRLFVGGYDTPRIIRYQLGRILLGI